MSTIWICMVNVTLIMFSRPLCAGTDIWRIKYVSLSLAMSKLHIFYLDNNPYLRHSVLLEWNVRWRQSMSMAGFGPEMLYGYEICFCFLPVGHWSFISILSQCSRLPSFLSFSSFLFLSFFFFPFFLWPKIHAVFQRPPHIFQGPAQFFSLGFS